MAGITSSAAVDVLEVDSVLNALGDCIDLRAVVEKHERLVCERDVLLKTLREHLARARVLHNTLTKSTASRPPRSTEPLLTPEAAYVAARELAQDCEFYQETISDAYSTLDELFAACYDLEESHGIVCELE